MVRAIKHEAFRLLFDDVEVKWNWTECELVRFSQMWADGVSVNDIGKELKINKRSIGLPVIEQAEQGMVKPRSGGLFGELKKTGVSLLIQPI